jgi:AraC-like DNA-binding protein
VLCIAFELVAQGIIGLKKTLIIHHYFRIIFYIPACWVVFYALISQKNRLYTYIFFGSLILILGSAFSLFSDMLHFEQHFYFGDLFKSYEIKGYHIYFFSMRTCVLLEVICFAFGLSYKNSQRCKSYKALKENMEQKNRQIEKIINTPNSNKIKEDKLIQQIAELLEKNFRNADFDTQALADELHMSRSKLFRHLKKKGHASPSHIIRQFRLEKARNLILTTDFSLAEIAIKTGFKEASHFSKTFKDFYKISPSELRLQQ